MTAPTDYCTLAEVKADLGIAVLDTTDDARIGLVITGVSRAIESYCGKRRFYSVTEQRLYTPRRTDRLMIDDCLAVTTLETDMAGLRLYEYTWPSNQYDLLPENAPLDGYPYTVIQIAPLSVYRFPATLALSVRITGDFGYSYTIPEDVHQAALYQVTMQFRGKDAPLGVVGGGMVKQDITAASLHPFTKRILWPYRKILA